MEFEQELGRVLLEEVLRNREIRIDRWSIEEIFAVLVETYDDKRLNGVAKKLGCGVAQAQELLRRTLPHVLEQYPRVLWALSIAAGARMLRIEMSGGGEQMALQFTPVSEERRVGLIQEFQESFSALLQEYEPFEVGVAFTGTPWSTVLLDLVRRYFRGRFLVEPCFPRLLEEPVEGFNAYREQIRAFYGLDPVEGPVVDDAAEYARALVSEASGRGWRILVQAVNGELSKDLGQAFERKKIGVLSLLDAWTLSDVLSYVDIQNLTILPSLLSQPKKEPASVSTDAGDWSRDTRGLYRYNGKMVKQDTVPDEIRRAFEQEDDVDSGAEIAADPGGSGEAHSGVEG